MKKLQFLRTRRTGKNERLQKQNLKASRELENLRENERLHRTKTLKASRETDKLRKIEELRKTGTSKRLENSKNR